MNKQIFSLLGAIGANPSMTGAKRLNSQYARVEELYMDGRYAECVSASSDLFEMLMTGLYLAVTGEKAPVTVVLSDISFWDVIRNKPFCDTAGMLQYACYRISEGEDGESDPGKAASLAKTGLDDVIGYTAQFLTKYGREKCVDPIILRRDDVREQVHRLTESLTRKLDAAGCSEGMSMQPPFMNACLLDFPEDEIAVWARYIAKRLQKEGLLTSAELRFLDAEKVVEERVGLTTEYIRRATAEANGGALLIEHFEEFDMPCAGGNLLDRALRTIGTAAETYRGSLCIVISGAGENVEKALARAEKGGNYFPLALSLK